MLNFSLILDFDNTFITTETLDELAAISLSRHPDQRQILDEIQSITKLGMAGDIRFSESLQRRLNLLQVTRTHIHQLCRRLKRKITPSIYRNRDFFLENHHRIYIISGGFREVIREVSVDFKIHEDHIFANDIVFDGQSRIAGIEKDNPLSQDHGKSRVIRENNILRPSVMVGDGYTDLEVKLDGSVDHFFAFTENVNRPEVTGKADREIYSFDAFLDFIRQGVLFRDQPKVR